MRLFLAILVGKAILKLSNLLQLGAGAAAPGYYALKIDPNLIKKLNSQIPSRVIITGTNGKTTTAKLLSLFLKHKKIIRNKTGSNLERGIASSLISHSSFFGKLKDYDFAIWEVDEAAFNSLVQKLNPQIIVFLNVLRDQLDRYGEIDTVVKKWGETLDKISKDTLVILNKDDKNLLGLVDHFKGKIESYSIKNTPVKTERVIKSSNINLTPSLEASNLKLNDLSKTTFDLDFKSRSQAASIPLPGAYNVYNFLAAAALALNLNIDIKQILELAPEFKPAFGRYEKISLGDSNAYLFLIKNPFGANQVFTTIAPQFKAGDRMLIALNDNFADGTDVSWIWDAEFEQLSKKSDQLSITVSGSRASDLALRLKYAGVNEDNIEIVEDLKQAFRQAKSGLKGTFYILPTYTALLELQAILVSHNLKNHYWKENS